MTPKERQTVTILASILAVLFSILLVVLGIRYQQSRPGISDASGASSTANSGTSGTSAVSPAYTAITYSNDIATLTFSQDDNGAWIWADNPDFPLDSLTIDAISDELANLKFQQTLPATEGMESYGLDNPSATLSATDGQGIIHTLAFGKTTTDGNSYYIQMNDDTSTVYIIADTLYQYLQTPIYDMCRLPELPNLTAESLAALSVQGPIPESDGEGEENPPDPLTTLLTARHSGENSTLWFSGTDNVSGNPRVTGLLEDLAALKIDRCIDYHPSSEASGICGFDSPSAVLTITYTGASGSEQTLVITIGTRLPDNSGRYIRLNNEEPIYFLHTDFLDPLMSIAASGLAES